MTNWQTNTKSDSSILEQNGSIFFLFKALKEIAQYFKNVFLDTFFSF